MDPNLFRYIWRHSKRDQLIIFAVVLVSLPFYFASLDLPRRMVNEAIQGRAFERGQGTASFLAISFDWPQWLGGGQVRLFEGFPVDRLGLLFGLSGLFLLLVVINGAFKYWINVSKGALGERMLRRMRFELFTLILRFTPDALRTVKSSETATIIKDEVEPIGGFIGDAFILPLFLGTQAATALIFIIIQNVWLGLLAGGIVGVQFLVIPRLRRELLRLGKQRQLASRRLAGRIGEVVDGIEVVHVHQAATWERAEIGQRLFELFDLRFRIYKRKFIVKFLNNFLAQMTPFFFYSVGGYFALRGQLDIGQLVAVIAAYRELPPPLKELIDWDQQRLDVQVKYDQVVQHFAPERLLPVDEAAAPAEDVALVGKLEVTDLRVMDPHGDAVLDNVTLACPLPSRVALVSDGSPAASAFARILARRTNDYSGSVKIGEHELSRLPKPVVGRRMAYAGVEATLFPGSIRDNLVYGLRHRPLAEPGEDEREAARRIAEAQRTGNPVESIHAQWIDCELAGVSNPDELDGMLIDLLKRMGLEEDMYRFGLSGTVDPDRYPDLAGRLIEARGLLREKLQAGGMAELVEPFDAERYNIQATVAENLLFGVPTSRTLTGRNLAEHKGFREALDGEGLTDDLIGMGARIAETMTEIFRGVPPGHPLFEQFSFIAADELPEYEKILRRRAGRGTIHRDDRTQLLALPLAYIEPRHRLGLLQEDLANRIVAARKAVREMLERSGNPGVEFYDFEKVNAAAPLRDNLLFGRISHSVANAQVRVVEVVSAVIHELGLRTDIERVGLDHQVGPAGRLLNASQRASVSLVRCIVKRPDIFVMDGALAPFGETRAQQILRVLLDIFKEQALFAVLASDRHTEGFESVIRFREARAELDRREPSRSGQGETPADWADREDRMEKRVAGGIT
jgi:putative ABC transport system ATP-binding protein